ncbi:MAG TPA: septum formation initiator family protein [Mycobacteriales bacterium]|nr:septum formation initiator family protein [Mycobacteriales bacterium]
MPATPRRTPGGTARRPATGRGVARSGRPVLQRRTAGSGRRPHRGGGLTGRAAVLGLVVSALVLTLAYPAQRYLAQQAQIAEFEQGQAAQRERIAQLEETKKKWEDPAYVRAQARARLQWVRPGEVAYVIHDKPSRAENPRQPARTGRARLDGPWYGKLWSGIKAADSPRSVTGSPETTP